MLRRPKLDHVSVCRPFPQPRHSHFTTPFQHLPSQPTFAKPTRRRRRSTTSSRAGLLVCLTVQQGGRLQHCKVGTETHVAKGPGKLVQEVDLDLY